MVGLGAHSSSLSASAYDLDTQPACRRTEALVRIGVLGTGRVAQTMAAAWSKAGHEVTLGSRDPGSKSLDLPVRPLAEVVAGADVVVNATPGAHSLDTLI